MKTLTCTYRNTRLEIKMGHHLPFITTRQNLIKQTRTNEVTQRFVIFAMKHSAYCKGFHTTLIRNILGLIYSNLGCSTDTPAENQGYYTNNTHLLTNADESHNCRVKMHHKPSAVMRTLQFSLCEGQH